MRFLTTSQVPPVYYFLMQDGTVITSRWNKRPGEGHIKPGTNRSMPIKFVLTKTEYIQCLENRTEIVEAYEKAKAIRIRDGLGWPAEIRKEVIINLMTKYKPEPLMTETFFMSMSHFI